MLNNNVLVCVAEVIDAMIIMNGAETTMAET